jgi:hypothetical protein
MFHQSLEGIGELVSLYRQEYCCLRWNWMPAVVFSFVYLPIPQPLAGIHILVKATRNRFDEFLMNLSLM